jgi:4-hydroxy-L-threonine phosphate dehydrogenase PdxA
MKNKIIIISGDPNSINSEIIFKSWKKINNSVKKKIYFISSYKLMVKQSKILKNSVKIIKVKNIYEKSKSIDLKVIDQNLKFKNAFKVPFPEVSKYVINSLNLGHKLGLNKNVKGIINCSIDKKIFKKKIGVTEYLATKCKVKNNTEVMLIKSKKLAVCPITTHIDIKEVSKKINPNKIINKVKNIDLWYKKNFNQKPKIGILGLNPHNSEMTKNSEEKRIIVPSISKLKKKGININGPFIADTIFVSNYKKYDVIVGMYHDQVLAPFKSLFKFDAINITLGLKYLRISPDHGTGIDLIKKGKANPISLIRCIEFVNNLKK